MSGGNVSKELMAQVEAVLPVANSAGFTKQYICDRVGMWAPITIKHALRQLCEEGRAERIGPHWKPLYRRMARENEAAD